MNCNTLQSLALQAMQDPHTEHSEGKEEEKKTNNK